MLLYTSYSHKRRKERWDIVNTKYFLTSPTLWMVVSVHTDHENTTPYCTSHTCACMDGTTLGICKHHGKSFRGWTLKECKNECQQSYNNEAFRVWCHLWLVLQGLNSSWLVRHLLISLKSQGWGRKKKVSSLLAFFYAKAFPSSMNIYMDYFSMCQSA